jgi:hypothetical protein
VIHTRQGDVDVHDGSVKPETVIGDGYKEATPVVPTPGIVIAAGLEKTVAAAGPAVQAINPAATKSETTPAIPFRLDLIPWRMCVTFPLERLL